MIKQLSSKLVVMIGILILISEVADGFIYQLRTVAAFRSYFYQNSLLMSDKDRGNDQFSGRGGGRFSSTGGRGRGRGRGKPLDRETSVNGGDSKPSEMTYDPSSEPEVIRLYAAEDRVPLTDLSNGQKLRGRIVSVKE